MDSVMYMMIAHSLSKYEVKNELGMDNPDVMIRAAEETFEEVRANTESAEAKARLTSAIKLLITLHKRVNDISETVKEIGHYDENMERLDMDIRVITDMIQDRITEYLYYESVSLEIIRQEMNARRKLLTSSAIMTTALLLVLSLWISALITRSITHPIAGLIEASDQIGAGNLDARAEVTGSPEIRTLADRFNSMAARIGELVENNRQEQIHLRNMELKLLQSQINPHFLYNTLDNIVWLAEDDRKEDVEKIAKALSAFFRSALSSGRDIIRISEEVRRELDSIIREDVRDPRVKGTYSVTRADVTRDLRYCKVYISVLEDELRQPLMKALDNARGFIRRELGKRVQLRYVPELIFESDTNIEYAARIDSVLRQLEKEHGDDQ